jgi:hypothetical protein
MDYINIFRTLFGLLLFLSIIVVCLISTYVTSVFGTFSKRTIFIQTIIIMFSIGLYISAELYNKDSKDKTNENYGDKKNKYIYFSAPIVLLIIFNICYYLLLGGILYAEKRPRSIKSLSFIEKIKGLGNISEFSNFIKERKRISLCLSDIPRLKSNKSLGK